MQTCLCQLNLFSNFPQGESAPLTPRSPRLPRRSLQLHFLPCPLVCSALLAGLFPTQVAQLRRDRVIENGKETAPGAPRIKRCTPFLS